MFVHGPHIAVDDDSSAGSEEEDVGDIVQVRFFHCVGSKFMTILHVQIISFF